ncbi:MAG TPA: calcium-binding protein [Phenylobacterium sp.]
MLADQGAYTGVGDLQLNHGGVTIRGVSASGQPMQAVISSPAASIFVLRNGADHLTFRDLLLQDTTGGFGAVRVGGDIQGLTLNNVDATNVRTFFAVGASAGSTASVNGLMMSDTEVTGYTSAAIKIAGASSNIVLQDIVLDGQFKDPSSFMGGVHLLDSAHDILIQRVTASNNLYTGTAYWNGDGFVAEAGVYNVVIRDTVARNNGDAGYDIKSSNTLIENALAEGNKKNFRFWGDGVTAQNIIGLNPMLQGTNSSQDQVWVAAGSHVTLIGGTLSDSDEDTIVFNVESGAVLTLSNVNVSKNPNAFLDYLEGTARLEFAQIAPVVPASSPSASPTLLGGMANDQLVGTGGDELIRGEGGDDFMRGGGGADSMVGGDGFDDMHGNTGTDTLHGEAGNDWVVGGQDGDLLFGEDGDDLVYGNMGNDTCYGGSGADWMRGGQHDDIVIGGEGDDFIAGDRGDDTVEGGAGADRFHIFDGGGLDLVLDFNVVEGDRVLLIAGTSYSVTQSGADTVVDLNGAEMILRNVTAATLPEGWIVFI